MWKYIQKIQHLPTTHENSFTRAVTVFMSSRWLWEILPGQKESHGSHKVFPWWTKIYLWAVPEAVFCKGMLNVFIMCTLSRELRFRKIWNLIRKMMKLPKSILRDLGGFHGNLVLWGMEWTLWPRFSWLIVWPLELWPMISSGLKMNNWLWFLIWKTVMESVVMLIMCWCMKECRHIWERT